MGLLQPKVIRDLKLHEHGLRIVERRAQNFLPLPDGRYLLTGEGRTEGEIAKWLAEKLGHENVYYIGLPSHPQYELACRQMSGFGGMISIELGTWARAAHLLGRVRVFALAESLGGVESLISHPATMTHASVPAERRAALGITDGLVRISAGIEDIEDLKEDLAQALDRV